MLILGLSAYYHDSAAALLRDGTIVAAAQEERFSRIKHDARFPSHAVRYCLQEAGATLADIDHVVFFEKPFLKFERLLDTYLAFAPRGFQSFATAMPIWLRDKLFQKKLIADELAAIAADTDFGGSGPSPEALASAAGRASGQGPDPRQQQRFALKNPLAFSEHHLSHAASAFYPSPFERALVLTMDGVGEWATTTAAIGHGKRLDILREIHFPHSLGLLYSAFTTYCGFRVNSGEYKLMGLAPYGEPKHVDLIRQHLIDIKDDGSFRLNLDYFDYCTGLSMTNARFHALFGGPPRAAEAPIEPRHLDLAASIQKLTEEIVLKLATALQRQTGERHLCLAGGVALNCVANGKLLREAGFDAIWIQPAAGDAGGALGAALAHWHRAQDQSRAPVGPGGDGMAGAFLGPRFDDDSVARTLDRLGAVYTRLSDAELVATAARDLADGQAMGWFQGRAEYGPRALGNRSILADPRRADTQSVLNLKVKFRESFRPFAPSVLAERTRECFDLDAESPYMLIVAPVAEQCRLPVDVSASGLDRLKQIRSTIPAVTHVDYSARVQTVRADANPRFHALLTAFHALTGCPTLVNTSFNVRGEPVVGSPEDAFRCFMGTHLDRLAIGNCYLLKSEQPAALAREYAHLLPAD
ncbi:MAG: carbamoyltransferase [Rhodanobacteraceae bacterium]|nr:carbamoyltransferase [Rhodanobacteraceae bacterium]